MTIQIATIHISEGQPSKYFTDGMDYDVRITCGGRTIAGEISLAPDRVNGGLTSHGGSIDAWCSDVLVKWMYTLTNKSLRAVASALNCGDSPREVEIEVEIEDRDGTHAHPSD